MVKCKFVFISPRDIGSHEVNIDSYMRATAESYRQFCTEDKGMLYRPSELLFILSIDEGTILVQQI